MALHDGTLRPNAAAHPPVGWRTLPRRPPQGHEQSRALWVVIVILAAGIVAQISYEVRRELTTSAQAGQVTAQLTAPLSTPVDFASRWP
jgi:hypothetical protein